MGTALAVTMDMLKVRTPDGEFVGLLDSDFSDIYLEYEKTAGKRNIIWKRRQLGVTTFAAAKGFLAVCNGMTGFTVVGGPHEADHYFSILEGFRDNLPSGIMPPFKWWNRQRRTFGFTNPSQFQVANREATGVGRGQMIDFLHFGEMAWWPLVDQRRAVQSLFPCLKKDSEVIIESTPPDQDGGTGVFAEIWHSAEEYGFVRHFFPWWKDKRFVAEAVDRKTLTRKEKDLVAEYGLTLEQIGWRRKATVNFGENEFKAQYAESEYL